MSVSDVRIIQIDDLRQREADETEAAKAKYDKALEVSVDLCECVRGVVMYL